MQWEKKPQSVFSQADNVLSQQLPLKFNTLSPNPWIRRSFLTHWWQHVHVKWTLIPWFFSDILLLLLLHKIHFRIVTVIVRASISSTLKLGTLFLREQKQFRKALWNVPVPLESRKCLMWIATVCCHCLKQLSRVLFSVTDSRFIEASILVCPRESAWKVLLGGLKLFTYTAPKAKKQNIENIEMLVNMLSSSVFRLFSTGLPSQRHVSIILCRRRRLQGAGACSGVGLEHGLDGRNGGSVQSALSWQKQQTLWFLGAVPWQ